MKVKLKEIRKLKDIAIQTSFIGSLLPAVIFFVNNFLCEAVVEIFSVTEFLPSSPSANIFLLIQ